LSTVTSAALRIIALTAKARAVGYQKITSCGVTDGALSVVALKTIYTVICAADTSI
jgi:hypothetical protein